MRHITLGGIEYPIRATVTVDAEVTRRYNDAILSAEAAARETAEQRGLNEGQTEQLVEREKKLALRRYLGDRENDLYQIALLINAAVDYERVLHGRDISADVPHYPLTAEKIGLIATLDDLNREETVQAVVDEFLDCRGGDRKNLTAGQLEQMASTLMESM